MKIQNKSFSAEQIIHAQRNKMIIAFCINIVVAILSAVGLAWSYYINYYENMNIPAHPGVKLWFWGWFTFISTAMIGVASLVSIAFMIRAFIKGKYELPRCVYVIKNVAIAATILTFFITQYDFLSAVLKDSSKGWSKIERANLIEHIIIPFLCVPSYLLLERTTKMKFVENCYSMIIGALYSGHYLAVGYLNIKDGVIPVGPTGDTGRYDRYGIFKMLGTKWAWVMIIAMCAVLFLFAWVTWLANKKIHIGEGKGNHVVTLKTVNGTKYYTVEKEKIVTKTITVEKPIIKVQKEVIVKEVPIKVQPKKVEKVKPVEKKKDPNRLSKGAIAAICAIPAGVFIVTLLLVLLIK